MDLVVLLVVMVFFAFALGMVWVCDSVVGPDPSSMHEGSSSSDLVVDEGLSR
jgi:hypothetical protein